MKFIKVYIENDIETKGVIFSLKQLKQIIYDCESNYITIFSLQNEFRGYSEPFNFTEFERFLYNDQIVFNIFIHEEME